MNDDQADRLRSAFDEVGPSRDLIERVKVTAALAITRAVDDRQAARRRRSRRRRTAAGGVVLALAGAAVATAFMLSSNTGSTLPVSPAAEPALAESPVLSRAPWLFQRSGSPLIQETRRLPSLRFRPGTTHQSALRQLVRSVGTTGSLPPGTRLAPSLPLGVVWAPGRRGPRLDLTAPFAFNLPTGGISPPLYVIPGSVSAAEAVRIAQQIRDGRLSPAQAARFVRAPRLAACQRLPRQAPCRFAVAPGVRR